MPGLSNDPDARQRQLDALARGRQSQAKGLLEGLGFTVEPGRRARAPRAKPGPKPRHDARDTREHVYPEPEPEPPEVQHAKPAPGPKPDTGPEPERAGLFARLGDGLRAGALD